jgi:hypothetical protein
MNRRLAYKVTSSCGDLENGGAVAIRGSQIFQVRYSMHFEDSCSKFPFHDCVEFSIILLLSLSVIHLYLKVEFPMFALQHSCKSAAERIVDIVWMMTLLCLSRIGSAFSATPVVTPKFEERATEVSTFR